MLMSWTIVSLASYREGGELFRREYHALTRGWILNEIVRRVDPQGRTIGEILREDVVGPLGADAFIGLTAPEMARVAPIENASVGFMTKQSLIPKALGRKINFNFFQLVSRDIFGVCPLVYLYRRNGKTWSGADIAQRYSCPAAYL